MVEEQKQDARAISVNCKEKCSHEKVHTHNYILLKDKFLLQKQSINFHFYANADFFFFFLTLHSAATWSENSDTKTNAIGLCMLPQNGSLTFYVGWLCRSGPACDPLSPVHENAPIFFQPPVFWGYFYDSAQHLSKYSCLSVFCRLYLQSVGFGGK